MVQHKTHRKNIRFISCSVRRCFMRLIHPRVISTTALIVMISGIKYGVIHWSPLIEVPRSAKTLIRRTACKL